MAQSQFLHENVSPVFTLRKKTTNVCQLYKVEQITPKINFLKWHFIMIMDIVGNDFKRGLQDGQWYEGTHFRSPVLGGN